MSYPRLIQPLIIEDDLDAHELYEAIFDGLIREGVVAPPKYAYCYEDAILQLTSTTIFHLVILDLRLPECPGLPAPDGVDHGLSILRDCEFREGYPIPCMLVISGYIGRTRQVELDERVRNGFAYGRLIVKGGEMEAVVSDAVQQALSYCGIGVHIQDSGAKQFPTLSPREDDLLRRCIMGQPGCTGVDVSWWSAEYASPSATLPEFAGWTKILMGRFLIENGDRAIRPNFFKFSAQAGREVVLKGARMMELKLSHIKIRSDVSSRTRWLLVTEKVGSGEHSPVSLSDYLGNPAKEVQESLPRVVAEIAHQVISLGDLTPKVIPIRTLLWTHLDRARLLQVWQQFGGEKLLEFYKLTVDPITLFDEILANSTTERIERLSFLHGDLNITNVALDGSGQEYHAYIFDAEGNEPGVCVSDLAMLEVTALLHQSSEYSGNFVENCAKLYSSNVIPDVDPSGFAELERVRNTIQLVTSIREEARKHASSLVYALTVFNHALIQLGGLAYTISRNKIRNPTDAVLLSALVAEWLSGYVGESN